ncbi:hypothetical protein BC835DRAFT_755047 [Cytidiella melzeri]|nr:hypothetical protein BC835DRAFT_755047 [Cytidiella melzeri]
MSSLSLPVWTLQAESSAYYRFAQTCCPKLCFGGAMGGGSEKHGPLNDATLWGAGHGLAQKTIINMLQTIETSHPPRVAVKMQLPPCCNRVDTGIWDSVRHEARSIWDYLWLSTFSYKSQQRCFDSSSTPPKAWASIVWTMDLSAMIPMCVLYCTY